MISVKSIKTYFGTNAERVAAGLNAFLQGDEFVETDTEETYQHNGMAWVKISISGAYLEIANNLSDLNNASTARTNLGLAGGAGDIWVEKAGDVMTGPLTVGLLLDVQSTGIIFNDGEDDIDLRIAGDGLTNGVYWDAGNSRLGLGTNAPDQLLHVAGNAAVVGYLNVNTTSNPPAGNLGVIHCYGVAPGFFFYEQGTTDNNVFFVYDGGLMQFQNRTDVGGFTSSPFVFDMTSATNTFRVNSSRVGIGTDPTNVSAKLEISSTTGALLLSRMTTTQQNALTAVNGMLIYNSSTNKIRAYAGGAWVDLH
jgi:hypothetical protein